MSMLSVDDRRVAEMVDALPAFPRSVQRILEMTANINCAPKDLVSVIEHDPVLTGRILNVVNSAYFGLSRQIVSIKHAVVFVGINTVKHIALSVAAIGALPLRNDAGFEIDPYLEHSLSVGAIARLLARRLGVGTREIEDFFVAGLLHDIGKVVLAVNEPSVYRGVLARAGEGAGRSDQWEMHAFGLDHAAMSAVVARRWRLPEEICVAIERHHDRSVGPWRAPLVDCLCAANIVVHALELENVERAVEFPSAVQDALNMDLSAVLATRAALEDEMAKAQVFIQLGKGA